MNEPAPEYPPGPALFACSPRAGGNSDQAALFFAQGLKRFVPNHRTVRIRESQILACTGCGLCRTDPERRCRLEAKDDSRPILNLLETAPLVFFASPIYFYHLPAMFKAMIDRGQAQYFKQIDRDERYTTLRPRKAYAVLVGGRPKGEKLFQGALLTLRYFLAPFKLELVDPLLFRGVDLPGDLEKDSKARKMIIEYGQMAGRELTGPKGQGEPNGG